MNQVCYTEMANLFYVFSIITMFHVQAFCDPGAFTCSGRVLDGANGEPLAYVNVGIPNRNIGTVTDENGGFSIIIPDTLLTDTIYFSYVGYEKYILPVSTIDASQSTVIQLIQKDILLREVLVSSSTRSKNYGVGGHSPILNVPAYIDKDIYEIAFLIDPGKKVPLQIEMLNMYIATSAIDSCSFRINLYTNTDGKQGDKINTKNIIIRTNLKAGLWNCIDLSTFDIIVDQSFYLAVEFLPFIHYNKPYVISYGAKMLNGGNTLIRKSSQGSWQPGRFHVSMNIDTSY